MTVNALKKRGLKRKGIFGNYHAPSTAFQACETLDAISGGVYDFVLVCTKSFDSAMAAEDLQHHPQLIANTTKIVLFQNGWGNTEKFVALFAEHQIFNARVITGFRRPKDNEVMITVHADDIRIGSLFRENVNDIEPLCQLIKKGGIPCEVTDHVGKDLWAKIIYNCALNPLGAILNVPYGVLGEFDSTRQVMKGIVEEIFRIFQVTGIGTHWPTAEEYLHIFYSQLLPPTASHESSMLQALRHHKRLEIDALNGAVIKLAGEHHIDIPYNRMVYHMIKFMEERNVQN